MPAIDLQREVRRAALSILKGDSELTAIVPVSRIYSQSVPALLTWPFIKFGPPQGLPIRAACTNGEVVSFSVHAFAKRIATETAEDYASRIGAHIKASLDKNSLIFVGGTIRFRVSEIQLLVDGAEADSFHYYCVVSARVIA